MLYPVFFPFLTLFGLIGPEKVTSNPPQEKIILVDVDIPSASEAKKCYLSTFDKKRVEVQVDFDDPLANLGDFELEEDPVESGDCYVPEMKIIYSNYTYVISLYCACVQKYKNSAPYTPSQTTEPVDIKVTESMLDYLETLHKKYFGVPYNPQASSKLVKPAPLGGDTDDIVVPEDKEDDDDVSRDAIDKEGWFDDIPDPVDNTNTGNDDDN